MTQVAPGAAISLSDAELEAELARRRRAAKRGARTSPAAPPSGVRLRLLPLAPGHTRADCGDARPCPWDCPRYRLDAEHDSCALDVAERGDHTLEEVADLIGGITRERVRQIEKKALERLRLRLADLER